MLYENVICLLKFDVNFQRYFNGKEQKFVLKLFEIQGKLQIDLTLFSDEQILDPEENIYLVEKKTYDPLSFFRSILSLKQLS